MKTSISRRLMRHLSFQLLLGCTLLFTSCDESFWIIRDSGLAGYWRVVEIEPIHGECPYNISDEFHFYSSGVFEVRGYGDFYETGVWDMDHSHIYLDFDRDGREDMVGTFLSADDRYLAMDVTDYSYRSRYRIRMMK